MRKKNPSVLILGNPPLDATLFGDKVETVEYHHVEDPADVLRVHDFQPGVQMYALENGGILLLPRDKRSPLWAHH